LQPGCPVFAVVTLQYVISNGLALLAFLHLLDLKASRDRFPWLQAEINDLDLARAPRLGLLLKGLVDHRAECVGVMDAEDRDRLVVLDEFIDQVASRPSGEALGRHERTVVTFGPAVILQRFGKTLLLDVKQLIEGPGRAFVILNRQRAERNVVGSMRVV